VGWSIVGPASTALKAFLPGEEGREARAEVKATTNAFNANYHGPGRTALQAANFLLGPPESGAEAGITLALAAIPGAKAVSTATRGVPKMGLGKFITKLVTRGGTKETTQTAVTAATRATTRATTRSASREATQAAARSSLAKKAGVVAAAGAGVALFGDDVGRGVGHLFDDSLEGIGEGLTDVGSAAGNIVADILGGVATGAKKLIVPGLIVGAAVLGGLAIKSYGTTHRVTRSVRS
jgi:hypothetical protein